MADNTRLPLGTQDGDTYASEDMGTYKIQRVKLAVGAQDAADAGDADFNTGNAGANTVRVVIATNQPQLSNKLLVTPDLPATASTSTKQSDGSQKTQVVDGSGNVVGSTGNALDVNVKTNAASNQSVNLAQVGGSSTATSATGVQKCGVVGNAGATIDATVAAGSAPTNAVATLGQFKATAPALTDTQTVAMQVDQGGNQRVTFGASTATLSVWNSSTSVNTTQVIYSNSGVTQTTVLTQASAGTFSTGAITFEVTYDGTNWVAINTGSVLDPTDSGLATISLPYTLVTSVNKAFSIQNFGWIGLRIKLSTAITGTGTLTPVYTLMPDGPGKPVTVASGGVGNNVNLQKIGNTAVSQSGGNLGIDIERIAGANVATATSGIMKVAFGGYNGQMDVDMSSGFVGMPNSEVLTGGQFRTTLPVTTTNNTCTVFQLDSTGNLKTTPGFSIANGLATWTSSTSINTTQTFFAPSTSTGMSGTSTAMVNLSTNSGSFSTGAITLEVTYDNVTWVTIPADCVLDPTSAALATVSLPYTLVLSTNKQLMVINRGFYGLRIKLSTAITGTGVLTINCGLFQYLPYIHNSEDYIKGTAVSTQVAGVQDVSPRRYTGSTGLNPQYTASHITTATTTTLTSSTAYITSMMVCVSVAGAGSTVTIQNKEGTPKKVFTQSSAATGNFNFSFNDPLLMTSGIDIVTTSTAPTVDVFVTYWQ